MAAKIVNLKYDECDVYIGRPSKWGNPFEIGKDGNRKQVIEKYEKWIRSQPHLIKSLHELKDKRLGCYCDPLPCHGSILIKLMKEEGIEEDEIQEETETQEKEW